MNRTLKAVAALLFALAMALMPRQALSAAQQAFSVWATSVAPALFPFFVILPALTCPEASALYRRLLGWLVGPLFGCPGESSIALCVGYLAGNPAAASATQQLAASGKLSPAQVRRTALNSAGCSPMFLISSLGAGMLGSPEAGALLARSQLMALILGGLVLRRAFEGRPPLAPEAAPAASPPAPQPVRAAVLSVLAIGGYIALFSVIAQMAAALLQHFFPALRLDAPLLAVLELAGGCHALSHLPLSSGLMLPLLAAAAGFGGLSVCFQSMSFLRPLGLTLRDYLPVKLMHAALAFGCCWAQLRLWPIEQLPTRPAFAPLPPGNPLSLLPVLAATMLLMPALVGTLAAWRKK